MAEKCIRCKEKCKEYVDSFLYDGTPTTINQLTKWIIKQERCENAESEKKMTDKIPCNTHELKILPKWFEDVQANKKNFEIRKNDRNFEVGDYLILKEWYRGKFTDRYIIRQIEYIYKGDGTYGLAEDYCVLGLKVPQAVMIQNGNNKYVECSAEVK